MGTFTPNDLVSCAVSWKRRLAKGVLGPRVTGVFWGWRSLCARKGLGYPRTTFGAYATVSLGFPFASVSALLAPFPLSFVADVHTWIDVMPGRLCLKRGRGDYTYTGMMYWKPRRTR